MFLVYTVRYLKWYKHMVVILTRNSLSPETLFNFFEYNVSHL